MKLLQIFYDLWICLDGNCYDPHDFGVAEDTASKKVFFFFRNSRTSSCLLVQLCRSIDFHFFLRLCLLLIWKKDVNSGERIDLLLHEHWPTFSSHWTMPVSVYIPSHTVLQEAMALHVLKKIAHFCLIWFFKNIYFLFLFILYLTSKY